MTKARSRRVIRSVRSGATPTFERKYQQGGVQKEVIDRDTKGNVLIERYKAAFECLLDYYRLRDKITEDEYHAGIKFRHAYMRAVLHIQVEDIGSGSHGSSYDMGILLPLHSEQILREAYTVLSPQQKNAIIAVCGHNEKAKDKDHFQTFHRGIRMLAELWETSGDKGYK
jgi:hypothetical protein